MLIKGPFQRFLNQDTLREQYGELRKLYHAYQYDINYCSYCISPFDKARCITNHDLRKWLMWVNTNVIMCLGLDWEVTTRIKLRIASSMLNKVDGLTDLEKVQIFVTLKDNINKDLYKITIDELPF